MDNVRLFLFFALAMILMLIWQAWEKEHPSKPTAMTAAPAANPGAAREVPATPDAPTPPATAQVSAVSRGERIEVTTDTFTAVLDTEGGDLRSLRLNRYRVVADKPETLQFLSDEPTTYYVAQSGIVGHGASYPSHKVRFESPRNRYSLPEDQNELRVPLHYRGTDGARYTKTYVFHRDSYVVDVEFKVDNNGKQAWRGYFYAQLARLGVEAPGIFAVPTFTGGAIYTPTDKYQKIAFTDMVGKPLKREVTGGWVAMLQHYFVGAWMPKPDENNRFWTDARDGNRYVIGFTNLNETVIEAGQSGTLGAQLYLGPKEQTRLAKLVPGMDLTVDYGALTIIAAPLFWVLDWLYRFTGNWGWAIIALTILIKLVFYPLSAASYKSMAHMKKVTPKMQALKERYGDDKQKLNQAMMELYKTEKINPLGGCLPILIQIPVFIALYWVLLESVEMRHAPFVLWIHDLSTPDPYYVFPIIMGITMYLQQMLNPQPMDPVQQKVFMIMPAMFTVMFLFFPAGLVLYWTVNNLLSIAQQWQINRSLGAT